MTNGQHKPICRRAILWFMAVWLALPGSSCLACPCSTTGNRVCSDTEAIRGDTVDGTVDACAVCRHTADLSVLAGVSCPCPCTDDCPCSCRCADKRTARLVVRSNPVGDQLHLCVLATHLAVPASATLERGPDFESQQAVACTALQRCISLSRLAL